MAQAESRSELVANNMIGLAAEKSSVNFAVSELGHVVLSLRGELVFRPHHFGGRSCYIIEDPATDKFYRAGLAEYAVISLFDGQTSVATALHLVASSQPQLAMSEQDAAAVCNWLVNSGLAFTAESANPARLQQTRAVARRGEFRRRYNPVTMRLPVLRPDRLFDWLTPRLVWLFSWPAFTAWAVLMLSAANQVAANWTALSAETAEVLVPHNWLWLALCWVALKCVHELAHGIVCKKYGGQVREAGVVMILLAPLAYVDVSTSWRFRSKWQRIHTAAAGVYVELMVSAAAALLWSNSESALIKHICLNLMIMASATSLLFNANPLMRFDGYYILSDWLELPNLYATSQAYLRYVGRKYCLGMQASPPLVPGRYAIFTRLYAVATLIWRVIVSAGLIVAVSQLYYGAGIILAAAAVIIWYLLPLGRLACALVRAKQRADGAKIAGPRAIVATGTVLLMFIVPWPAADQAPGVVEFSPLTVVRAGSSGFLAELHAHHGELVEEAQLLAVLKNDQLAFELADLKLALEQAELRLRMNDKRHKIAQSQGDAEVVAALLKHIHEKQSEVDQLTIRAARSGRIIGKNLSALLGKHLRAGDELFAIGGEDLKEVRLSIGQEDLTSFESQVGEFVQVRISGYPPIQGQLSEIQPRASLRSPHHSLWAAVGGPLAVTRRDSEVNNSGPDDDMYDFVAPRFSGTVTLDQEQSAALHSGRLAVVLLPSHKSVGGYVVSALRKWSAASFSSGHGAER